MTDFYSLLKQSIIDRGLRAVEDREAAYSQARTAMVRRLWSFDPPLSEEEIDSRIGQFDLAVDRIETVVVEAFAEMPETVAADGPDDLVEPRADEPPGLAAYEGYDEDSDYAPAFGGTRPEQDGESRRPDDDPASEPGRLDAGSLAELLATLDVRSLAVEEALNAELTDDDPPPPQREEQRQEQREPQALVPVPARTPPAPIAAIEDQIDDGRAFDAPEDQTLSHARDYVEETDSYDVAPEPVVVPRRPAPRVTPPRAPKAVMRRPAKAKRPSARPAKRKAPPRRKRSSSGGRQVALLLAAVGILTVGLLAVTAYILWPNGPGDAPAVAATGTNGDAAAAAPPTTASPENRITLFDGTDPTVFNADPSNPIRFDGSVARISTSAGSAGARALIGPGLAVGLAGRTVRVTLMVRAARENGSASLRFAYQSGLAVSHWQTAGLTSEFIPIQLEWRVPKLRTDPTGNAILIEPGIPGDGTAVEISAITIDLV